MRLGTRLPVLAVTLAAAAGVAPGPAPASGQVFDRLQVEGSGVEPGGIRVSFRRGFASVPLTALESLGWTVEGGDRLASAVFGDGRLKVEAGQPFVGWRDRIVQLVDAPYSFGGEIQVPLQLLVDFLPAYLPEAYDFDPARSVLTVRPAPSPAFADPGGATRSVAPASPSVVIIDAGHGGQDPGTRGRGGSREKDLVLSLAMALQEELAGDPDLEVHMIRDRDVFVPLWERGELATRWKGDRPGVYISLHVNAAPNSTAVRGFESYFLAEARTEHARRLAAVENASLHLDGGGARPLDGDSDLGFILKELRTFDHEHWSALLAEIVQEELARVHPGPNRGVKQAPLAVLTNALMPSVLVEIGYITNRQEEQVLRQAGFQRDAARAIAAAARRFLERYPPGRETSSRERP